MVSYCFWSLWFIDRKGKKRGCLLSDWWFNPTGVYAFFIIAITIEFGEL
jgi:hypothetical protein